MTPGRFRIRHLRRGDAAVLRALNLCFAAAFDDSESYADADPGDAYLETVLGRDTTIVLVAECDGRVAGGLVAYVLEKFEQRRDEIYIYDLAVDAGHRRRGIATALIGDLRAIADRRGGAVIYVQADPEDGPAVALYQGLGVGAAVLHFDFEP